MIPAMLLLAAATAAAATDATIHDFGKVRRGPALTHEFLIENKSGKDINVVGLENSDPALTVKLPRTIKAGAAEKLELTLDTRPFPRGVVEATASIETDDPSRPTLVYTVRCQVEQLIDVQPFAAVFLSGFPGETKEQTLKIVNNGAQPLTLRAAASQGERTWRRLAEVEAGRIYEFTAGLRAGAPTGEAVEILTFETGIKDKPQITIRVNARVKPRIYVEPREYNIGTVDKTLLAKSPETADFLRKIISIRQMGGKPLNARVASAPSGVTAKIVSSANGLQADVQLGIEPADLKEGPLEGVIVIETDDAEFSSLRVAVKGAVR